MSADLHPEALLEKARSGLLSDEERAQLDAHLAECEVCALCVLAEADFSNAPLEDSSDDVLIRRISEAAIAASAQEQASPMRWAAAAVALLAFVGTAGAATYFWVNAASEAPKPVSTQPREAPRPEQFEEEVPNPVVEVSEFEVSPRPSPPKRHAPRARPDRDASTPALDAESLLRDGNEARRTGQLKKARAAYEKLVREFPSSREASVVRVSLGRLLLDRLGDPKAALVHFEAYLKSSGSTAALGAEALSGKARSLQKIGRGKQELATWKQLLEKHPSSHHAAVGKQRIQALEQQTR